jgi:hypothetical protein
MKALYQVPDSWPVALAYMHNLWIIFFCFYKEIELTMSSKVSAAILFFVFKSRLAELG